MTDFLPWFVTGSQETGYFYVSEFIFSRDREFEYCNFQMLKRIFGLKEIFYFQQYLAF